MQTSISLEPGNTIVFIGDSITDVDCRHPAYAPLGRGYVHFAGNLLMAKYPHLNPTIVNTGVGGDTVLDLQRRWETDCLACQPNIVSVLIGINDAWYMTTESGGDGRAASPEQYEVTYDQLLLDLRDRIDCQIVVAEPFVFSDNPQDVLLSTARAYIAIARRLAVKYSAVLVPLQREIDKQIGEVPPERWSQDKVHPYPWAHAWIAQRWLEATGL
jgi:lysophospholipase L1-like esterase